MKPGHWQGDGESTKGKHHDDDVRAVVTRTTRDVGDHDGSTTSRATEWAIQRKGCLTLSTGLQGGDAVIWDLEKIASDILQSGGYG